MVKTDESLKTTLLDILKNNVFSIIKKQFDDLMDNIHEAIIVTQKKFMRALTATLFMLLGFVFLIIGGTFFLTDVLKFGRTSVYLTTGAILVLVSVILAQSAKLLKYDFRK